MDMGLINENKYVTLENKEIYVMNVLVYGVTNPD